MSTPSQPDAALAAAMIEPSPLPLPLESVAPAAPDPLAGLAVDANALVGRVHGQNLNDVIRHVLSERSAA